MAGYRDDSAGDYGTWSNDPDQSWLNYFGMKAHDVGTGAMNALSNISGAMSPIGTSHEGNMSLQVPPMISGLGESAGRFFGSPDHLRGGAVSQAAKMLSDTGKPSIFGSAYQDQNDEVSLGSANFQPSQARQSAIFDPFGDIGSEPMTVDESNNRQRAYRDHNRKHKHQAEARSMPDAVWPSPLWWEQHGVTSPDILDRYGAAQSAVLGAIDGLGLGFPKAITNYLAPETANSLSGITNAHHNAHMAGELAGFVGGPATKAFRAAGDKLLAAGYGTKTAAAADALSAAGLQTAPSIIEGDGIDAETGTSSGVAAMSRYIAPYLPNSALGRIGVGAAAGVLSGIPSLVTEGFPHGVDHMLWGGIYGAAMKGKKTNPEYGLNRSDYVNNAMSTAGTVSAISALPTLARAGGAAWDAIYNSPSQTFGWNDLQRTPISGAQDIPDWLKF